MGVVYGAFDPVLGRRVALKLIQLKALQDDGRRSEFSIRFAREMRASSAFFHDNIIRTIDAGIDEVEGVETAYYVMEWIEGESLSSRLDREGEPDPAIALRICAALARGLEAAHAAGRIHRDLKPSNVMLGEADEVKISDFGLCKFRDEFSELTVPGAIIGTPHYLAPEQIRGDPVCGATDLFALGVILVRVLVGDEPFAAPTISDHLNRVLHDSPDGLDTLAPRLRKLAAALLAKHPQDRPVSAGAVALELESLATLSDIRAAPKKGRSVIAGLTLAASLALSVSSLQSVREPFPRVHDAAGMLAAEVRTGLSQRLELFHDEAGVDVHAAFASAPSDLSVDEYATREFDRLAIGRSNGRGLLFLFDPETERLRIEVGYGLEPHLPDSVLGRMIEDHARFRLASGDIEKGLGLAIRMLEDRLRWANLAGEFEVRAEPLVQRAKFSSGGGGASGATKREPVGETWPDEGESRKIGAGRSPEEAFSNFLAWLSAGSFDANAELFTEESRTFLAQWPMTPGYLRHLFDRESVEEIAIHAKGDRALVYCTSSPSISPHFLRRTSVGWQVDIVAEVQEVVSLSGTELSWSFRDARSPNLEPFSSELIRVDRFIRLHDGDNRPMRTFQSARSNP